jgi:hypothetical protein
MADGVRASSVAGADLYVDPRAGVERPAGQVEAYWELAIALHWGRFRALLGGDLLYRRRKLGRAGTRVFGDLADSVKWRDGSLQIKARPARGCGGWTVGGC